MARLPKNYVGPPSTQMIGKLQAAAHASLSQGNAHEQLQRLKDHETRMVRKLSRLDKLTTKYGLEETAQIKTLRHLLARNQALQRMTVSRIAEAAINDGKRERNQAYVNQKNNSH